ncbi:DUF805 domain-containing protein [Chitinolyticbacter albus]|uniref:DUF805 domain-containing protein n=1 Tax=Chitinolyticbacter albus TaxID=2961951 RepID=UPI00210A67F2|nr:DUF805 domain-containing protein [Chitinolyticbacter albus]
MSETVRLVLTGEVLSGHERDGVRDNLAALLKLDAERSARLLDTAPTVIKQQLPLAHVDTYLALLAKAGAGVRVEHPDGRPWQAPTGERAFPSLLDDIQARPIHPPTVTLRVPPQVAAPVAAVAAPPERELGLVEESLPETIKCPSCALEQPKRTLCTGCGTDMPRMLAAQNQAKIEARQAQQMAGPRSVSSLRPDAAALMDIVETPKLFGVGLGGRLGRMRYLAYGVLLILAIFPITLLFSLALVFLKGFWVVFGMAWVWLFVRLAVFRLHDVNQSGWWAVGGVVVSMLISLIDARLGAMAWGLVTLGSLALCFWPGSPGDNRYGPPAEPPTTLINVLAVIGLLLSLLSIPAMLASVGVPGYGDYVQRQKLKAGQLSDEQLEEMAAAMREEGVEITADELREQMKKGDD